MMNFKKIMAKLAAGAMLLGALTSCGGPELLGILPVYNGPAVTSTAHEFKNEDFMVIASYDDGTDKTLDPKDFKVVVEGMEEGYYILNILYDGEENECFVKMDLPVYPSDQNG